MSFRQISSYFSMLNDKVRNLSESGEEISRLAAQEGLLYLGAAPLNTLTDFDRFAEWLQRGNHAGMTFLERNQQFRQHPEALLPGAQSALVFALNYYQGDRSTYHYDTEQPRAAQYARLRDYHKVLKDRCGRIAAAIHLGPAGDTDGCSYRVLVDSAPILERAVAGQTGRGFIGKNTCFISPDHGSFLLLAEVLSVRPAEKSPAPIDPTVRTKNGGCGTCQRCQVHCPTGALDKAWTLDARKCLSYWTIEHRGCIPDEYWPWLGTYWFGCDICQLVCPWNRHARISTETGLRRIYGELDLAAVATMDQAFYEATFGGSPMTRAKREGLRRNATIAMAVTDHPGLAEVLDLLDGDPDAMLRETAARARQWHETRQKLPT